MAVLRSLYWVLSKSAETISAMRRLILNRPLDINWVVGTSPQYSRWPVTSVE